MKKLFLLAATTAMMAVPATVNAQDKVEASIGADLVSNYIWRGLKLGGPAIQPSASVSYKGLSLEAWGSYGLAENNDCNEIDFTLSYTLGGLTIGVNDCFTEPLADDNGEYGTDPRFFMFDARRTSHTFTGNIGYDFDIFSVNVHTIFTGADYNESDGKRAYSTYVELAAPFKLGGLEWNAAVGLVAMESDYYETDGLAVTNVTLQAEKEIKITDSFSLPVFGALTANPHTENVYFTFGISL